MNIRKSLPPASQQVWDHLVRVGNITAMDAMRALGMSGSSLTRRLTDIRSALIRSGSTMAIRHTTSKDPVTGRKFGRWTLVVPGTRRAGEQRGVPTAA